MAKVRKMPPPDPFGFTLFPGTDHECGFSLCLCEDEDPPFSIVDRLEGGCFAANFHYDIQFAHPLPLPHSNGDESVLISRELVHFQNTAIRSSNTTDKTLPREAAFPRWLFRGLRRLCRGFGTRVSCFFDHLDGSIRIIIENLMLTVVDLHCPGYVVWRTLVGLNRSTLVARSARHGGFRLRRARPSDLVDGSVSLDMTQDGKPLVTATYVAEFDTPPPPIQGGDYITLRLYRGCATLGNGITNGRRFTIASSRDLHPMLETFGLPRALLDLLEASSQSQVNEIVVERFGRGVTVTFDEHEGIIDCAMLENLVANQIATQLHAIVPTPKPSMLKASTTKGRLTP